MNFWRKLPIWLSVMMISACAGPRIEPIRVSTGHNGATAVSGTAARFDDTACAAGGWVSFDTVAAAAQAADAATARDDAWRTWVTAQAAAWPE